MHKQTKHPFGFNFPIFEVGYLFSYGYPFRSYGVVACFVAVYRISKRNYRYHWQRDGGSRAIDCIDKITSIARDLAILYGYNWCPQQCFSLLKENLNHVIRSCASG